MSDEDYGPKDEKVKYTILMTVLRSYEGSKPFGGDIDLVSD